MQDVTACPLCGNKNLTTYEQCRDHLVTHEVFLLRHCNNCDVLITTPRPPGQLLHIYYQSQDYVSHSSSGTNFINRLYLISRAFTLKQKLIRLNQFSSKGRLLDVGCGTGNFVNTCKKNGWQVEGVEPSPEARRLALKITPDILPSIEDLPKDSTYNAITLWHVLEHLTDPNKTIQTLKSKLDATGTIFIAVPNYKSYDAQHYRSLWAGYDVPRHLWHFSQTTIKKLCDQNELKLQKILPMKLDSFYVSLLSEKYKHNGNPSVTTMIKGFYFGLRSNIHARQDQNYSSLLYIITK